MIVTEHAENVELNNTNKNTLLTALFAIMSPDSY